MIFEFNQPDKRYDDILQTPSHSLTLSLLQLSSFIIVREVKRFGNYLSCIYDGSATFSIQPGPYITTALNSSLVSHVRLCTQHAIVLTCVTNTAYVYSANKKIRQKLGSRRNMQRCWRRLLKCHSKNKNFSLSLLSQFQRPSRHPYESIPVPQTGQDG